MNMWTFSSSSMSDRIPGKADLSCYWFERARALIETKSNTNELGYWRLNSFAVELIGMYLIVSRKPATFSGVE